MHELKNTATGTPRRYQDPEVFEQLAIEYAVGSLQGRARKRFEVLMETHFYLRATVDAYETKFAHLVELLPDHQPANNVWNNIEAHIKKDVKETTKLEEKTPWWQKSFFKQGFGFAAMALLVSVVYFYDPMTNHNSSVIAYNAVMESNDGSQAMAVTKIQKSDMKISIDIMKPVEVEDGMVLTLWCRPKKGGKLMKMGTISKSGKTEIDITKAQWNNLDHIDALAVSVEKEGKSNNHEPSDQIILKGTLSSIK